MIDSDIQYRVQGTGPTASYAGTCACGDFYESWNAGAVLQWGTTHHHADDGAETFME